MRRLQPHLTVFISASRRLAHFAATVTPQTPCTHSSPPSADNNKVFPFLHNFSSLVANISQNPRNFIGLKRLDFELRDAVERLDCASLVFVVKGLCKIRKLQRAKNLVIEMRRSFVGVSSYFWYGLVFDCLVSDGGIDAVEIMWKDICRNNGKDEEVDVFSYVMYVCRFGDLSGVRRVCERVLKDGKVLSGESYVALIGALCRFRDEGCLAKEVVHAMDHARVKVDDLSYFVMYRCYCVNGNLEDADWILRRLVKRGFKMDVFMYGSFLYALCKSGKVREADKLFRKMIRRGGVEKSCEVNFLRLGRRAIFQLEFGDEVLDVMAYETYFHSLCSVGRLDEAEKLFKEMLKMRIVPQTCVHACFIKALFRAGRDHDALKFFSLEKKKQHICTDEIVSSVIKGLCQIGRSDDALEMLNEVISKGSFFCSTSICNTLLKGFWKEMKIMEAEALFKTMNGTPYGFPDASTYSIMIHGLCRHKDIAKALDLFRIFLERKFLVNKIFYEEILSELSQQGRPVEAHKLLNSLLENGHLVSFADWNARNSCFF